jgi:class 3 adenylate cyclase
LAREAEALPSFVQVARFQLPDRATISRAILHAARRLIMAGTRKIAAILVADIVGYGRLAGSDEDRTLSRLRGLTSDVVDPAIEAHHGRMVKRTGDASSASSGG